MEITTQPYRFHSATTTFPPSPLLQFPTVCSITLRPSNNFTALRSRRLLRRRQNCKLKATRGSVKENAEVLQPEGAELPAPTCITRSLPPALTLEHGLQKIKDAVDELKSNPPRSRNGMYRIQVAVPPSPKALDWFCCQPQTSGIFPLFFLSKEMGSPPFRPLSLSGVRGVFGIGANLLFKSYSSFPSAEWNSFKRYLYADPAVVLAYGFPNSNFDVDSSSVMHNRDSFYLFIPQIELDELEGISILATTLVWGDSFLSSFEEAILSLELAFSQVSRNFLPTPEKNHEKCISSCLRKFNAVEDVDTRMVRISALSLIEKDLRNGSTELKNLSSYCRFSIRLSDTLTIANNLCQLDGANKLSYSIQNYPNINTLWASLIVEECCRLGLTYFCIAPGSRSSPLAIAASTHSLTTCIACFDERSLAFHAVGYGRGSHKPAVVITSSGTAVSNLLPAVVEASQDFVPLLLLTADRPPELQDSGANQAINQINHFGQFSRFFYGLPVPSDDIPARMVLTTVDSAIHWATGSPSGPVHINCPFREPLDSSSRQWMLSCLKGLDTWSSSFQPFTNYIQLQYTTASNGLNNQMEEVLKVVRAANKGFLLIGKIHTENEIWAALLLAMHLEWPVITDILSGLRLRKFETQFQVEKRLVFIDYMDHSLLSKSVKDSAQADVIVQIGSRITSKRISQMIEDCFPRSYILVENHPCRHDPSHIVTHRIQSTITQFVDCFLRDHMPAMNGKWCAFLQDVDKMVAWELSFLIHSESSLTEPYVAHMISKAVRWDSAIFVGNSMAIRDADMYGANWPEHTTDIGELLSLEIPCHWINVAGNRGASGIDGLLSTATGFAVGCNKRVICLLGDVSFLHDTNGLALLKQRIGRKPMTIVVINNHGGAIFSLLPIADRTERRVLDQYFYTSHNVSIKCLSLAHCVKHVQVKTKMELQDALLTSQQMEDDCVIEVASSIDANANFHRSLRQFASQTAEKVSSTFSRLRQSDTSGESAVKAYKLEYSLFRIQLRAPPTSSSANNHGTSYYREGFIIALSLEDGSIGYGEGSAEDKPRMPFVLQNLLRLYWSMLDASIDLHGTSIMSLDISKLKPVFGLIADRELLSRALVSPLEIHLENLIDVEEQLRFMIHAIQNAPICYLLPLLKGSFSSWIWSNLGIPPGSVFPSVRCGLEMAVLNAIAAKEGSSLSSILHARTAEEEKLYDRPLSVQICALIDSDGTPEDVAEIASELVKEGFNAIKIKVARRADPVDDAVVIQEVRKKVGPEIHLRADANRKWTYEQAIRFGSSVMNCKLQYIEEPVQDEDDIIKFCEVTGLPVALDETIDNIGENPLEKLAQFIHPGVVAIVIKPSVVGGFENAALLARWAQQQGKMSVVSATFESSIGLSAYVQFSSYLELQNECMCKAMNKNPPPSIAHGLGTYRWLSEDVTSEPLKIQRNPYSGFVEASVAEAGNLLGRFEFNHQAIVRNFIEQEVLKYMVRVDSDGVSISIRVQELGLSNQDDVFVFLHGFLGTGDDWLPIMKAISGTARCIAVDLPGHGRSKMLKHDMGDAASGEPKLTIEVISDIIEKLLTEITPGKVNIVGYSMGARIALYMALRCSTKVKRAVIVSGSPGLEDMSARKVRSVIDDSRACTLIDHGLKLFVDSWYAGRLWQSLRSHPHFERIVFRRLQQADIFTIARVLSDISAGRQPSLWEDLRHCKVPLLLVVGEKDSKFKDIANKMFVEVKHGERSLNKTRSNCEVVEVPMCGHAVHIENPLFLVRTIRQFLERPFV